MFLLRSHNIWLGATGCMPTVYDHMIHIRPQAHVSHAVQQGFIVAWTVEAVCSPLLTSCLLQSLGSDLANETCDTSFCISEQMPIDQCSRTPGSTARHQTSPLVTPQTTFSRSDPCSRPFPAPWGGAQKTLEISNAIIPFFLNVQVRTAECIYQPPLRSTCHLCKHSNGTCGPSITFPCIVTPVSTSDIEIDRITPGSGIIQLSPEKELLCKPGNPIWHLHLNVIARELHQAYNSTTPSFSPGVLAVPTRKSLDKVCSFVCAAGNMLSRSRRQLSVYQRADRTLTLSACQ